MKLNSLLPSLFPAFSKAKVARVVTPPAQRIVPKRAGTNNLGKYLHPKKSRR